MRGQFERMERGELEVVKTGKRALALQAQPVDEDIQRAVDQVFRERKVLPEKQQQYRDALDTVHYGGAEDATLNSEHHLLARYPIGSRGRANASDRSALRGAHARRLSKLLPEGMANAERNAIVTELLIRIGFADTTSENVGSILDSHRRQELSK
jgi:hypothetical protein